MRLVMACALAAQMVMVPLAHAQEEAGAQENAVQQPVAAPQFTVVQLLSRGFEVKAMSYSNGAVVILLQGGIDAFLCETDVAGRTRACVALK